MLGNSIGRSPECKQRVYQKTSASWHM